MVDEVLSLIVESQSAEEVWQSIEEHMLPATKEQESWLRDGLYSLKKGNIKLEEFLKKFKSICDDLAAIGKPILDEDKVFHLARSLGPKYSDFKTAMLTKPPYPNLKQFITALKNHEQTVMSHRQEEIEFTSRNQAFLGQRGRGRKPLGGRHGEPGIRGSRRGNLYVLDENEREALNAIKGNSVDADLWHKRLGHPSHKENNVFPSANDWHDVIESTSNCDQEENHQATSTPARTHYCCDEEPNSHKESMHNKNSNNEGQEPILVTPSSPCIQNPNIEENIATLANPSQSQDITTPVLKERTQTHDLPDISNKLVIELPIQKDPHTFPTESIVNTHPMVTRHKLKQNPNLASQISLVTKPKTLKSALRHPQLVVAMKDELHGLHQNNTWSLVPRPSDANIIRSKWVYRIKYTEKGTIERFEARLVAKGFTQIPGINFEETFNPVFKHTTIQLVLSLAVNLNWTTRQLDVRNAFLHGHLKETVYMEQPPGFINPKLPSTAIATPIAVKETPGSDDNELVDATEYRKIVGSLQYLTFTRPDITYVVNQSSKKQATVARSSAEVEYRSMASTAAELTWLTYLLSDIGIRQDKPPGLICDNMSALHMAKNPIHHARTKHIELDYHFVREKVTCGLLTTKYIPSLQQTADIFTKPLSKELFIKFRYKLGIHSMAMPSLRGTDKITHHNETKLASKITTGSMHSNKESPESNIKTIKTNVAIYSAVTRGIPLSRLSHHD
ncbi:retrovirus-related pol polyprotein from transposon RE1 [Citrus sinensis]|nr:retrovirus-related pol polyprotein from transposon RE1 [Citrus sinensis]